MLNSVIIKVLNAIVAQLSVPPVAEKIYLNRGRSIPAGVNAAVDCRFVRASGKRETINGPIDWRVWVAVDTYARTDVGAGDIACDALATSVFNRLADDPSLGGIVSLISVPEIEGDVSDAAESTGWMSLVYEVLIRADGLT